MKLKMKHGLLAMMAATAIGWSLPASAQTMMRYSDLGPNRGIRADSVNWFLNEIEQRSEGRIRVQSHWGASLLQPNAILEGVKNGVAHMATTTASYSPRETFAFGIGDLPLDIPSEAGSALGLLRFSQTNEFVTQETDEQNVMMEAIATVGYGNLICQGGPVNSVEDLRGKRIVTFGRMQQLFVPFGAINVTLGLPEVYSALDSGLIDCANIQSYIVLTYRLYEVADHYVVFNGPSTQANGILMNKDFFVSLTPQDQEMVLETGREFSARHAAVIRDANRDAEEQMRTGIDGHAINVIEWTEEERAKVLEAGNTIIQDWLAEAKARGIDGEAMIAAFEQAMSEEDAAANQ